MLTRNDYVTKPGKPGRPPGPERIDVRNLCSRCAMSPERRSTWPGHCPLAAAVADLCPFKPKTPTPAAAMKPAARPLPQSKESKS
jgi:hypothetical protein